MAAALEARKGAWFTPSAAPIAAEVVQHCVLPRLLQSPADARYAARFLLLLHAVGAPYFSTLLCLDHVRARRPPLAPPAFPAMLQGLDHVRWRAPRWPLPGASRRCCRRTLLSVRTACAAQPPLAPSPRLPLLLRSLAAPCFSTPLCRDGVHGAHPLAAGFPALPCCCCRALAGPRARAPALSGAEEQPRCPSEASRSPVQSTWVPQTMRPDVQACGAACIEPGPGGLTCLVAADAWVDLVACRDLGELGCAGARPDSVRAGFAWKRERLREATRARAQVIKVMLHVIVCCTEREAENLATFMLELLSAVDAWRVRPPHPPGLG